MARAGGYYGAEFKDFLGLDPGGPDVTNNFHCSGGCGGAPLNIPGGRGRGCPRGMGERVANTLCLLLCRDRIGSVRPYGVTVGDF